MDILYLNLIQEGDLSNDIIDIAQNMANYNKWLELEETNLEDETYRYVNTPIYDIRYLIKDNKTNVYAI